MYVNCMLITHNKFASLAHRAIEEELFLSHSLSALQLVNDTMVNDIQATSHVTVTILMQISICAWLYQ